MSEGTENDQHSTLIEILAAFSRLIATFALLYDLHFLRTWMDGWMDGWMDR
jgi:hypothetical protein